MITKKGVKKLEIGPGLQHHPGYTTVDIEKKYHPDILGDFRDMKFENLEEVRTHHLLEHFDRKESIKVLKQWISWLKKGGKLTTETPDFERICSMFTSQPPRLWGTRDMMTMHAYGSQESSWAHHKSAWWKEKFEEVLPKLGMEIELIKANHSYYRNENNIKHRLPNILAIARKK